MAVTKEQLAEVCDKHGWKCTNERYTSTNSYRILAKGYRIIFNIATENFAFYQKQRIVFRSCGLKMFEIKLSLFPESILKRGKQPNPDSSKTKRENEAQYPFSAWMTDFTDCDMS